jgi:hypothetical protein
MRAFTGARAADLDEPCSANFVSECPGCRVFYRGLIVLLTTTRLAR